MATVRSSGGELYPCWGGCVPCWGRCVQITITLPARSRMLGGLAAAHTLRCREQVNPAVPWIPPCLQVGQGGRQPQRAAGAGRCGVLCTPAASSAPCCCCWPSAAKAAAGATVFAVMAACPTALLLRCASPAGMWPPEYPNNVPHKASVMSKRSYFEHQKHVQAVEVRLGGSAPWS